MKNAKVVSSVASNKPDGLSIALIIILVLIIVACILWYMFYKPKNEVISRSVEGFSDKINHLNFKKPGNGISASRYKELLGLTLRKDLNSISIYRSDSHKIRDHEFYSINKNLDKKIFFLKKIGESLGKNIKNTISENYLKYFRI